MKKKQVYANRNAMIRNIREQSGKYKTETHNRDDDSTVFAITTDPRSNTTVLFMDFVNYESIYLSGAETRTLYRLLNKHYRFTGKAV